jgi:DNA-binding XRE family transcriptional regulator
MAKDIGISKETLVTLENAGVDRLIYPNLKTLLTIADYFEVDESDFLTKDLESLDGSLSLVLMDGVEDTNIIFGVDLVSGDVEI